MKYIIWIGGGILALLVGFGLILELGKDTPELVARRLVKNELKAPSTADFRNVEQIWKSDSSFAVLVEVDAENSYGAKLRDTFCVCLSKDLKKSKIHKGCTKDTFSTIKPVCYPSYLR